MPGVNIANGRDLDGGHYFSSAAKPVGAKPTTVEATAPALICRRKVLRVGVTRETESRMGIKNPVNIRQNIIAGARYLKLLIDKLPKSIQEPDRTWIALAAYNQGYGRIVDARTLAKRFDLNPDLWIDLKKMLPLLNRQHYTSTIKYGQARGDEAVALTNAVRAYYEILKSSIEAGS